MRVFLSFKPPNGSLNKIHSKWTYSHTPHLSVVMYWGCLGDWYNSLGTQILGPKKHFSSFLFLVAFQKKHADVAINNFTKHLITSNWCKRKKYRQKGKKWEKKPLKRKKILSPKKVFIHLNTKYITQTFTFSSWIL